MTPNEIRERAEADFEFFIRLVSPGEHMGACHQELIRWWTRPDAKSHQLVLYPRDHGKSRYVAYRVVWELTKDPTLRVIYLSATSNLAEKQLTFMKNIFTSKIYQRYWPDHVHPVPSKRKKWNETEIELDHPLRGGDMENVRDPSIFCGGLTTGITGMHCDIAVFDDIVVQENAYTEDGRKKVRSQYSLLASIEGAEAREWVVGTRYHPKDLYSEMLQMKEEVFNEGGEIIDEQPIYEVLERPVEDMGDGTGEFLWPRSQRKDGKWFGFNRQILSKKRGQYLDRLQFRAQYYNDPSDPGSHAIDPECFQYYDSKWLTQSNGYWMYKDKRLNLVAAVDFAYSLRKNADYTCIVVIGVDADNNIYVLDIDRFKTDSIGEYFDHLLRLSNKWGYRKLVAETTAAQSAIVKQLKENYFAPYGLSIKVEEVKPTRHDGTKEERLEAVLNPRYDNRQVYHYRGGNTQLLEEELMSHNPSHDDIKDALSNAIDKAVKPAQRRDANRNNAATIFHPRFGGRSF